ncbi:MAG: hypothetical protein BGO14_00285 [Chlamydiales bacterium 38-26]|nr:hypothetical protein [Chlamydiales bacterium]OJV07166.1 MAG: hypothetical protein BGO14_00285 [Chlamydiales bacterium 38-26]
MRKQPNKIQMDDKYRICLGSILSKEEREQLSSFRVSRQEDGKIILDPLVEIPARDHWIYKNPEVLASLMRGIEDAKSGRIIDVDIDFSQFLDEDKNHVQD